MLGEYEITKCTSLGGYKLDLTFADGKSGIVDLSYLVGKGVFSKWKDYNEFAKVSIDPISKATSWEGEVDLDPVVLKQQLK